MFSPGQLSTQSGEPLQGVTSHAEIGGFCGACHAVPWGTDTMADYCVACHTNIQAEMINDATLHGALLGKQSTLQCNKCHSEHGGPSAALSNIDVRFFPHNKLGFSLKAHQWREDGQLFSCKDCHSSGNYLEFSQDTCTLCHLNRDQAFTQTHALSFGFECTNCHDGVETYGTNFNHARTAFKLTGQHAKVECTACHLNAHTIDSMKSAPQECSSCHAKDDPHGGRLGGSCGDCHSTEAWKPAGFDHNLARFQLLGKHARVACEDCHKNNVFVGTPMLCAACHQKDDPHNGQFPQDCGSCHSPEDWKRLQTDHSRFAFQLTGEHLTVKCESCHVNGVFKGTPQNCYACHANNDPHAGQLGTNCAQCHSTNAWKPVSFDHNSAAFKLTGAHASVKCVSCHKNNQYKGTPMDCVSCHQKTDPHKGQFGTNCAQCHSTSAWKPATFDHTRAAFHLTGKHLTVKCESCHINGVFKGTPQDCFSCHQKTDPHMGQFGTNCAQCHSTSAWKPSTFNHNFAAFTPTGAHISVKCTSCHINGVFKGTPQTCFACHSNKDTHGGQLGPSCEKCHTTSAWKPANFNHNNSIFKLTGAHGSVACSSCHKNNVFKGTPQTCYACHSNKDPHGGKFGTNCEQCHSTSAWKPATFNHNNSVFKLTGAHVSVNCTSCHINGVFKGTPQTCFACHSNKDPHGGQLGTACEQCHTTSAWKPATFNHNNSIFKLTGAHGSVACSACHKNNVFKGTPQSCFACHSTKDPHGGQLGTACEKCHTTSAWKPATFNHNNSVFKLTGAHVTVNCTSCHINGVFKGPPHTCLACHANKDPHGGQLGTNCEQCHSTSAWKPATFNHNNSIFKLTGAHVTVNCTSCHINGVFKGAPQTCFACHANKDAHAGQFGTICAQCHTTSAWKPSTFDHNNAAFKLTGAHVSTACSSCHINGVFKGTPTTCGTCHAKDDNHGGKFGTNCGACHSTSAWKPATFDHNLTKFPLTGAHGSLPCAQCHGSNIGPLPTACSSCHADPAYHAGMFSGQACSNCHKTSAWRPATYNGPHSFPMNHGNAQTCSSCHQPNLTRWSCYACHNQAETIKHHAEKGITDLSNCLQCHPSGRNP